MKKFKVLSLYWHSVESDSIKPEYLDGSSPTASMFSDQIKFIINKYTPISVFDFMELIENRNLIRSYVKPPVLLGFDDGFKNVIDRALPVLREFNVPAVFFVIGEILKNPDFVPWYVEMIYLIRKTQKKTVIYDNVKFDLVTKEDRTSLRHIFVISFKGVKFEKDRERLLRSFASLLNVERPKAYDLNEDLRFVCKEDLSKLPSSSLLTVASHAMTHRNLASLTYEEQVYELEQSDSLLRECCPSYYPAISYPDGSFNNDTVSIVNDIYKSAFALFKNASYSNLYAYPRIGVAYETVQELAYLIGFTRLNFLLPVKRFLHKV